VGDTCDANGQCVSGSDVWECPEQTACNVCQCDPDRGCVCEGINDEPEPTDADERWTICGPDDLDTNANGHLLMDDCEDPNGGADWDDDNDGLPNVWEEQGADLNCDGVIDIRFDVFDTAKKNLFWELDHMAAQPDHDHEPPDVTADSPHPGGVVKSLVITFDDQGIELKVDDQGAPFPHHDLTFLYRDEYPPFGTPTWSTFTELEAQNFDAPHRRGVYTYVPYVHEIFDRDPTNLGGKADIRGVKALISNQAPETLLHEKGHNMDLRHGGDEDRNYKTNYQSVMNYGVGALFNPDHASGRRPPMATTPIV
jgi:hypothetical protein